MRTPYAGGEGGSTAKTLPEMKRRRMISLKNKKQGIERQSVLINAIS
jgi:hypothetical protein